MSNLKFSEIMAKHNAFLEKLGEKEEGVSIPGVKQFISSAVNSSKKINYVEDREQLAFVLRYWGSYIGLRGEKFPNIDIDHTNFRPKEVKVRAFQDPEFEERVPGKQISGLVSDFSDVEIFTTQRSQNFAIKDVSERTGRIPRTIVSSARIPPRSYSKYGRGRVAPPTVMVASPEDQYRIKLRGQFEAKGYQVVEARNKQEILDEIQQIGPSNLEVVIIDTDFHYSRKSGFVKGSRRTSIGSSESIQRTLRRAFGKRIQVQGIKFSQYGRKKHEI